MEKGLEEAREREVREWRLAETFETQRCERRKVPHTRLVQTVGRRTRGRDEGLRIGWKKDIWIIYVVCDAFYPLGVLCDGRCDAQISRYGGDVRGRAVITKSIKGLRGN
jgi:hypothetical protein